MGYDPRAAAVIGLCIGAILLAAVLFPAAGIDGAPASTHGTDGETSGAPAGDGSGTDSVDDGSNGGAPSDGTDRGASDGRDDGSGDDGQGDGSGDTGSEREDPAADDDGSEADGANGSGSVVDPPAAEQDPAGQTWIDSLFEAVTIGLVIALVLLASGWAYITRDATAWTAGSGGDTDPLPDGPLPRLRGRLARIPQLTMMGTILLGRQATAAATAVGAIGRHVGRAGLLAGVGFTTAIRSVTTISIGLPSIPRLTLPSIGSPDDSADTSDRRQTGADSRSSAATPASEGDGYTEPETVEEAWRRLVASLAVRRPSVRTPRECAAVAIDAGLPREAVETMTATFEAVRYGGAARTPDRLDRVRDAYARVRDKGGDAE